jgi:hypothetical protein
MLELELTVAGVEITIPMPFYYETSEDEEPGGTFLEPDPVRGPLKNNFITGVDPMSGAKKKK